MVQATVVQLSQASKRLRTRKLPLGPGPMLPERSEWLLGVPWCALALAARACPNAARALDIAARVCPGATRALGMAARACPGPAQALAPSLVTPVHPKYQHGPWGANGMPWRCHEDAMKCLGATMAPWSVHESE